MQKELNPELFGGTRRAASGSELTNTTNSRYLDPATSPPMLEQLELRWADSQKQISTLQKQMASLVSQVNDFVRIIQDRLDRSQQSFHRGEIATQELHDQLTEKISHLHSRIGERKSQEIKISELMDRHSNLIRSFELRLSQMNKQISDRDTQLANTQVALQEARTEIARLKRLAL